MKHEESKESAGGPDRAQMPVRQPWTTPQLFVHGDVARLTGKMFGGSDLSGVLDPFASPES